jgi:hypothetical protein
VVREAASAAMAARTARRRRGQRRRAEARATGPKTHRNKEGRNAHHLAKLRAKRRRGRSGGEGDRHRRPEVEDGGGGARVMEMAAL